MDTVKNEGLQHVFIYVDDIEATRSFYVDVLGFREIPRHVGSGAGEGAWFDIGNGQMIHTSTRDGDPERSGQHFALEVPDIDEAAKVFNETGVDFIRLNHTPGGGYQLILKDPSGNYIECNQSDGMRGNV